MFLAIVIPVGGHVSGGPVVPGMPVDPGFGQGTPLPPHVGGGPMPGRPPHIGGGPVYPGGPVDPGWGQGHPLPPGHVGGGPVYPGGPVDPGYGQGHPMPPHVGGGPVMPPGGIVGNPLPPTPPPGWVIIWVPGLGWAAIKTDARPDNTLPGNQPSVTPPMAPGGPAAQPKS